MGWGGKNTLMRKKVIGILIVFHLLLVSSVSSTAPANTTKISGDFSQGGTTFPFNLTRKDTVEFAEETKELAKTLGEIRMFIDSTMRIWQVPGLAIGIVKDAEVILAEGFGLRNIKDNQPATENTLFPVGSSSKTFMTMAMEMLVG